MPFGCRLGLMLLLALLAGTATLGAQDKPGAAMREQSAAVLARYPDLPIAFDTPALQPGRKTYTSQAELEAYLAALPRTRLATLQLGSTAGGRNVHALLLSDEGKQTTAEIAALGRPIVWLIGQQHGNEPAGSEAMLALARALADGELTPLLSKLSVVIIPRANPDGAAADARDNSAGADLNRDHGLFSQPETKLIHALVRQLPPAVVVDAHEFTAGRRWVDVLGGLQSVDLMLLAATHPMVAAPVSALAREQFQPAIERAISSYKLTSSVYHTMSTRAGERTITVGGTAPGIARNAFGLMGAVSFLLETRGVGIGLQSYQRRVATHYIAAKAVLETAAALGSALTEPLARAAAAEAQSDADLIVAHTSKKLSVALTLVDGATAQDKPVSVDMLDTRVISTRENRARPLGYVIPREWAAAAVERFQLMGATWCRVDADIELPTERYEVIARLETNARAINPERAMQVRVTPAREHIEAGSLYVPLEQPAAARIALALEPDAPGAWQPPVLPMRIPRLAYPVPPPCGR